MVGSELVQVLAGGARLLRWRAGADVQILGMVGSAWGFWVCPAPHKSEVLLFHENWGFFFHRLVSWGGWGLCIVLKLRQDEVQGCDS